MSIYIVASIIALLSLLACYAFISQSIEKKRVQKQRMLMALKTKHRNFVHMISGFPQHFLTNDLMGLLYKALINTCEQLSNIEPENNRHQDDIALFSSQLNALSKNTSPTKARIENPQQMKDIRQHLQELLNFLLQQEALKAISKTQNAAYQDQIKHLAMQMSVDAYIFQAKQAQQSGKIRLAIHYFSLAKKLLEAENATHTFDKQIIQLSSMMTKLEEKALTLNEAPQIKENVPKDTSSKEWDNMKTNDNDWKKKQIYD